VAAGDYKKIEYNEKYKNVSFRLFVTHELYDNLKEKSQEIFEMTLYGLKFYEKFFGVPFPFYKYD